MRENIELSIDEDVLDEAQALGIDMPSVARDAIAAAVKIERNRRWVEGNREALDQYAEEVEREGLPLGKYRMF